jgi:hypothetical protein
MVRKMVALLVSSAVLVGSMNAAFAQGAATQPGYTSASMTSVQSAKADRNATPLPAGVAAGIRQAQGAGETVWTIVGLGFLGGVVLAMIFVGNDEDENQVPTTTTAK